MVVGAAAVLGVDVGGTFTDLVRWDGDRITTGKVPSTAPDQSVGVVEGVQAIGHAVTMLHGTTVATNALLERKGARTALITDRGFEDVIEIGRQDRPSLYDSLASRPSSLVPRGLRFASDDDDLVTALSDAAPEAVAITLLYGYARADEEAALAARIGGAATVSTSSRVAPEFREFERTSTTVLNAYLSPVTSTYLDRIARARGLPDDLAVMRSSGGVMTFADAAALPAAVLLSGPAGGVVAAAAMGSALGHAEVISFDMGGTSTDVCRIRNGQPEIASERAIDGYPCRLPAVAVHTVGAGGGSVAWLDKGGALRVGPRSAGAWPGPACYGRGGEEATVTDANLVLGRLSERLAGDLLVDRAASLAALGGMGMTSEAAAAGVVEVVEEVMAGAVRRVSVEEGADPRQAVLVGFGGAGGLHTTALARRLQMAGAVVPPFAGVFSALGLLLSPPRQDTARSLSPGDSIDDVLKALLDDTGDAIAGGAAVRTSVDVRYLGQSHETTVSYAPGDGSSTLAARFHRAHQERNGFSRPDDPIEVVTGRVAVTGRPALRWADLPRCVPSGEVPHRGRRPIVGGEADVWWRPALGPGDEVTGPAIIEEPEATTWLGSGERVKVHETGAMEIEW